MHLRTVIIITLDIILTEAASLVNRCFIFVDLLWKHHLHPRDDVVSEGSPNFFITADHYHNYSPLKSKRFSVCTNLLHFILPNKKKKTCFIFLIIHIFIIKRGFSLLSLCARESDIGQLVFPPFMNSNFMYSRINILAITLWCLILFSLPTWKVDIRNLYSIFNSCLLFNYIHIELSPRRTSVYETNWLLIYLFS